MRAQSAGVSEYGEGGQGRFMSLSLSMVASRWPTRAAAKHGKPARTGWGAIVSGRQMGTKPPLQYATGVPSLEVAIVGPINTGVVMSSSSW